MMKLTDQQKDARAKIRKVMTELYAELSPILGDRECSSYMHSQVPRPLQQELMRLHMQSQRFQTDERGTIPGSPLSRKDKSR
jgi:hypothetical protein